MTRRERLMATLRGERVDRPPVSFYEIDGSQNTQDPDVNTVWTLEHLLKDVEDAKAWLDLPDGLLPARRLLEAYFLLLALIADWAAASRAIGTRNGLQLT